jgi:hypothetical protein
MEREYHMLKSGRLIRVEDNGKLVTQVDHATHLILETSLTPWHQFN